MSIGGFHVRHHAVLGSTSDEAKRLAEEGCTSGTVVQADEQTAGRGRAAHHWHSPPGNLHASVVLRPASPASVIAEIGFVAAVAMGECVAGLLPPGSRTGLKWPNDVQVDGAKIAGLLPEAACVGADLSWVVIGAGLNLVHAPEGLPYKATSLHAHGTVITIEQALDAFLAQLAHWLARWQADGFAPIRAAWLARASGLGSEAAVMLAGRQQRGTFRGLDMDGAILLDTPDGAQRITAGDVAFGALLQQRQHDSA